MARRDFSGQFRHNLDQNNRMAIPKCMRDQLGDEFKICFPMNGDHCLFGYAMDDWFELLDKIDSQESPERLTKIQRAIYLNSVTVTFDKQGRITIPANFMQKINLKDSAYIFGSGRRLEIWNPEDWGTMNSDIEDFAETIHVKYAF